jgi:hypothetical protein
MPDLLQVVADLVWVGLALVWLAYIRSSNRSRMGAARNECINCGAAIEPFAGISLTGRRTLCAGCFRRTQRNYRAAPWLCFTLSACFVIAGPFIVADDYRYFGTRDPLLDAGVLVGGTLLVGLPGWLLRRLGRNG